MLTARYSQYTREKRVPRNKTKMSKPKPFPIPLPIVASSSCSTTHCSSPLFFQPVWLHHISFLLHQLGFVMPTTISSIPFLFIYPYMPIFVFFCIDMRAFACGCAPACFCERGVPSHLFVSLSFFFCHGQLSCYIS